MERIHDRKVDWVPFEALRICREGVMTASGTPESVFPLLCPVREFDWIDVWECRMVYARSGVAERDCVFLTSDPDEVWTFSEWVPPTKLGIVRMSALAVVRYAVDLEALDGAKTRIRWCEIATALSEEGNAHVAEAWSEEVFGAKVARLERFLEHYLRTGTCSRSVSMP